jgi:hypothetical protein
VEQTIREMFESYPPNARKRLSEIRELIFKTAEENDLGRISEELKWGELSYATKEGSPIRIAWKIKYPNQVSVLVNCRTLLIETYKEVYGNRLHYVGNRELVFQLSEPLPLPELRGCISIALQYHKLKKLPLLGA